MSYDRYFVLDAVFKLSIGCLVCVCVDSLDFVTPRLHLRDPAARFRSNKVLVFEQCANKFVLIRRQKEHQQQKSARCV